MAVTVVNGFETGDLSQCRTSSGTVGVQGTITRTGGYALRSNPTTTGTGFASANLSISSVQKAVRFYFYAASFPSNTEVLARSFDLAATGGYAITISSTGVLRVYSVVGSAVSTAKGSASSAISTGTWYRIDIKRDTDVFNVSIDGTEICALTESYSPSSELGGLGKALNYNNSSVDFYYDDVLSTDTAANYPLGAGRSIARQPAAGLGTPNNNAWTKSTGTDAGALWDNTPYTNTDYCSTATQNAQTSLVSDFSTGTNAIGASDTINGCLVGLVAKTSATTSNGTNCFIRRRVNSADTDTLLSLTTSEAYYQESTVWTATLTNLDGMEAGAATTLATRTRTVYDVWTFVDYTPAAASTPSLVYNPRRHALPSAILTR